MSANSDTLPAGELSGTICSRDREPRCPRGGRRRRPPGSSCLERIDEMRTITPATLAGELAAATPTLNDEQQHLALSVYRLLADGEPVDRDRLAARTGLAPEHVAELLAAL